MADVRRYCDRAMLIQDGHIALIGDPDAVADAYSDSFLPPKEVLQAQEQERQKSNLVEIKSVTTEIDGEMQKFLAESEDFDIKVVLETDREIPATQLYIDVYDGRNVPVLSMPFSTDVHRNLAMGRHVVTFAIDNVLAFGDYRINIALQNDSDRTVLAENVCRFHIKGIAAEVMSVVNPQKAVTVTMN